MSDNDILIEIAMSVGELKADMAIVKADVAELRAAPGKKRQQRLAMLAGFVGLAGLVVALVKLWK